MISMMKMRSVFGTRSRNEVRRATMKRRAQFSLRPVAEGLEGRELMANLGLDPTFGFGGIANTPNPASTATADTYSSLKDVAVQSDGKILGVGTRTVYQNQAPFGSTNNILVQRVNADGTLDGSFGSGGQFVVPSLKFGSGTLEATEVAAALQADGKLVILARASGTPSGSMFSINDFAVIRIMQNGALDTSFGDGGVRLIDFGTAQTTSDQYDTPTSIAIGPNGQIVVAGSTFTPSKVVNGNIIPGSQDFAVAQLSTNGALDTSFGTGGKQTVAFDKGGNSDNYDGANAVAIQPDGKVVLVGYADVGTVVINGTTYQNSDIAVARLTAQGAQDSSFGNNGLATISYDLGYDQRDTGNAVVVLDNQIVIAGSSNVSNNDITGTIGTATLTRLSTTAAISSKFTLNLVQQGISFSTSGETLNVLSDSTLLLGGTANGQNGSTYGQFFTNFFAGGGINNAYGTNGTSILSGITAAGNVEVQPDGKLVFSSYSSIARTTAPDPAVLTSQLIFTSTGKNAKSNSIVIKFNTTLNPAIAGNKKIYQVRIGKKGRRFAAIRRVSYDAATQTLTITLRQKFKRNTQLFVLIPANTLASVQGQFLGAGQPVAIPIVASN
ncbi:MAG: hypothetical protein ABS79_01640 [Planctomycetes bacterium SCN 63-9]|nr:MAG: hypothetical protein ABS79_01640 [Planctomycetes bacterium SCN 63-9]